MTSDEPSMTGPGGDGARERGSDAALSRLLDGYLAKAAPRFAALGVAEPGASRDRAADAAALMQMAGAYYADARHFHEKGDHFRAMAALEYAEGWLDAGVRLGLLETVPRLDEVD